MRIAINIILSLCIVASSAILVPELTNQVQAAAVSKNCKCGRRTCIRCRKTRRPKCRCPKCNADVCELTAECITEKRKCFDVDQKVICIPAISWPWRSCKSGCDHPACPEPCGSDCECKCRCSNRCAKAKTVNVLTVKEYECKTCQYKWKVKENSGGCDGAIPEVPEFEPTPLATPNESEIESPQQPQYDDNQLYDPAGSDVPTPPTTNRINN